MVPAKYHAANDATRRDALIVDFPAFTLRRSRRALKNSFFIYCITGLLVVPCATSHTSPIAQNLNAVETLEDLRPNSSQYAVLVSVNQYADSSATPSLQGAKNDMDMFAKILVDQFDFSPDQILRLHDRASTRKGILVALSTLKKKAGPDKQFIFAFAGHGSSTNDEKQTEEADSYDETICPYDRDAKGAGDITDDELYAICVEILEKGAYLTLVLDSCHSGNASKGDGFTRLRTAPPLLANKTSKEPLRVDDLDPYSKRFTFLAASKENESAQETWFESGRFPAGVYGVFSHGLLSLIQQIDRPTVWASILPRLKQEIGRKNLKQTPTLRYGQRIAIFGQAMIETPQTFRVSHVLDEGKKICLNVGETAGIQKGSLLSVYPFHADEEESPERPLANYRVLATSSHHTIATLIDNKRGQPTQVIEGSRVRHHPDGTIVEPWPVCMDESIPPEIQTSLKRHIAEDRNLIFAASKPGVGRRFFEIAYSARAAEKPPELHLRGFPSPLQWSLESYQPERVARTIALHMQRAVYWHTLLDIRNARTRDDEPFPFEIKLERGKLSDQFFKTFKPVPPISEDGLPTFEDQDVIRLSYTNRSSEQLFITVFYMGNLAIVEAWNRDQFDAEVQPGDTVVIEALRRIIPPFGEQWIKVMVNREEPLDPAPFLQGSKDPKDNDQDLSSAMSHEWLTLEIPFQTRAQQHKTAVEID